MTADEIRHAVDELARVALVGSKTGRPDYVSLVALDKLLRWHEAVTALCYNLQQHRSALAALDTILFPADDHDPADKERMREQLITDLAEIMERRGWAGTAAENADTLRATAELATRITADERLALAALRAGYCDWWNDGWMAWSEALHRPVTPLGQRYPTPIAALAAAARSLGLDKEAQRP